MLKCTLLLFFCLIITIKSLNIWLKLCLLTFICFLFTDWQKIKLFLCTEMKSCGEKSNLRMSLLHQSYSLEPSLQLEWLLFSIRAGVPRLFPSDWVGKVDSCPPCFHFGLLTEDETTVELLVQPLLISSPRDSLLECPRQPWQPLIRHRQRRRKGPETHSTCRHQPSQMETVSLYLDVQSEGEWHLVSVLFMFPAQRAAGEVSPLYGLMHSRSNHTLQNVSTYLSNLISTSCRCNIMSLVEL